MNRRDFLVTSAALLFAAAVPAVAAIAQKRIFCLEYEDKKAVWSSDDLLYDELAINRETAGVFMKSSDAPKVASGEYLFDNPYGEAIELTVFGTKIIEQIRKVAGKAICDGIASPKSQVLLSFNGKKYKKSISYDTGYKNTLPEHFKILLTKVHPLIAGELPPWR